MIEQEQAERDEAAAKKKEQADKEKKDPDKIEKQLLHREQSKAKWGRIRYNIHGYRPGGLNKLNILDPIDPSRRVDCYAQREIEEALLQNDETRVLVSRMQLANDRSARPVQLHHRTLDEVSDFFLAGIPMGYDSSGTNLQLDATAIIDLYATAGGERIQLVDETSYGMEIGTTVSANADGSLPLFFLYQLDTTSRRWELAAAAEP